MSSLQEKKKKKKTMHLSSTNASYLLLSLRNRMVLVIGPVGPSVIVFSSLSLKSEHYHNLFVNFLVFIVLSHTHHTHI